MSHNKNSGLRLIFSTIPDVRMSKVPHDKPVIYVLMYRK